MTDADAMRAAIVQARAGIATGQSPFGAVILRGGAVVASAHNAVWLDGDPTAHAEVKAIRRAAVSLGTIDLSGCAILSTCEPCPMCLAAIHWSKLDRVAFGATIADAAAAGFTELHVAAAELARLGGSRLMVEQGPCRDECRELFEIWKRPGTARAY